MWVVSSKEANGLDIPYVGYLELDIQVLGKKIPGFGALFVKDTACTLQQCNVQAYWG